MELLITFFIALSIAFLLSKRFSSEDRRRVAPVPEVVHSSSSVNNDDLEKVEEVSSELETSKEIQIEDCVLEDNEKVEISSNLVESVNDDDATLLQDYEVNELEGLDNVKFELEENEEVQVQLMIDSSVDVPPIRDYEVNELRSFDNSNCELEKEKNEHNFCETSKVGCSVDASLPETSDLEGVDNVEIELGHKEKKEQRIYETSEIRLKLDSSVESLREVEIVVDDATLIMVKENSNNGISSLSNIENLSALQVFDDNSVEEDKSNEVLGEVHPQIVKVEVLQNDGYLLKEEVTFPVSETKTDQGSEMKIIEESEIERESCNSVAVNEFPSEGSEVHGEVKSPSNVNGETLTYEEDEWEGIERSRVETRFCIANAYSCSKIGSDALSKLSNDVQMQLYGLHKIATEGPCYEHQPMVFKVSARAKWHSWQRLGNMDQEAAMEQYMTLLSQNLPGWMGDRP